MKKKIFNSFLMLFFIFVLLYMGISLWKIVTTTAPDFHVYYFSAKNFLEGKNPYVDKRLFAPFNYPPFTLLAFTPFTIFSLFYAQALFVLLSLILIPCIIFLSQKIIFKKFVWQQFLLFTIFALLYFPTKFTLGMGQSNIVGLFFLILAFFYFLRAKKTLSGFFFGLSIIFKPIFIFFILFFLLYRQWKLLITTGIFMVICSLIIIVSHQYNLFSYYIFFQMPSLFTTAGREVYYNQGILGFVSRLTAQGSERSIVSEIITLLLMLFVGKAILLEMNNKEKVFSLFLALLVIVDTLSWQHHFVFLIFPFLFIAKVLLKDKSKNHTTLWLASICAYLFLSINIPHPNEFHNFPFVLVLSHTFYGACVILVVLLTIPKHDH